MADFKLKFKTDDGNTTQPTFMGNVDTYRRMTYGEEIPNYSEDTTTTEEKSTYDLQKDQAYEELLDKEISLENAKAQALKYTQNTINAQGFGGTGYGSTLQTGIYNNYLNRVNEGVNEYNNKIDELDVAEREANYNNITTQIESSASVENLQEYLKQKKFGNVDAEGNFVWNAKPADLTDDEWVNIQTAYNNQVANLGGIDNYTGATYDSIDNFRKANVQVGQNEQLNINKSFNVESQSLFDNASNGNIQYNGVVKMVNGDGKIMYAQYTSKGMRVVDESTFNKAKNKYEITVTPTRGAFNIITGYNPNFRKI